MTQCLPLSWSYRLATWLSQLQYTFSSADRQAVISNLTAALNREPKPHEVKEVFDNFAKYLVDFLTMKKRFDKTFIHERVAITGIERIQEIINQGKGGIMVSAHLGNWEMGAAVLSTLGYPLAIVALPHADSRINQFFNQQRESFGSTVIPTSVAVRRVLENLKEKKLVAILAERDFGHHGMRLPFLGKTAMIPKGAAIFSLKTGAPIVPCFFIREGFNRFSIAVKQPIYPPVLHEDHFSDEQLAAYINTYLKEIEAQIRLHPTQWLMFRDYTVA